MFDVPLEDRPHGALLTQRASEIGSKTFLRIGGTDYSYAEVESLANRLARGLLSLALKKGDHVAVLLDNSPEFVWTYFALTKLGAVCVPVNTAAKGETLRYYLTHSDAIALVVDERLFERYREVQDGCPLIRNVIVHRLATRSGARVAAAVTEFGDLLGNVDAPVAVDVSFEDVACLLYTSGTTGPSKACIWPYSAGIDYAVTRANKLGYQSDDVLFTCLPLFHGNAMFGSFLPALVIGGTVALSPRFSASRFWLELSEAGATVFNSLGAMTNILWKLPPSVDDVNHHVRICTMVPVPEFAAEFEQRFHLTITSVYGLIDFGLATILGPDDPPSKKRSAGRARVSIEVSILDDTDLPVDPGVAAQICLRSCQPWITSLGYYKMPQETIAANRNQWFHTGDRGYLDAEGYLYFVGRDKDAIRRRGENISAWEVEQIIMRHAGVAEVAAYPIASELSEDEVAVTVVLNPGHTLDPADLVAFCQQNMSYFMVPRFVQFATSLPKTATHKVEKHVLRRTAEGNMQSVWDREEAGIDLER